MNKERGRAWVFGLRNSFACANLKCHTGSASDLNLYYRSFITGTLDFFCIMPRFPRGSPSSTKLICPIEACRKECRSHSGLSQHINSKHKDYQPGLGTPPSAAALNDSDILDTAPSDISSLNDELEEMTRMSIPPDTGSDLGGGAAFGSTGNHESDTSRRHSSVGSDFGTPPLPFSQPHSPSQESRSSDSSSSISVEYHPLINGQ